MARSDLLVALVRSGLSADRKTFRTAIEAIIAEERAKQHNGLAETLSTLLRGSEQSIPSSAGTGKFAVRDAATRGQDYVAERLPRRRIEDLVLTPVVRRSVEQFLEEQLRADILRAHGLEPRHRVILVGPPGTGKTSLAEALAERLSVPLFVVRYEAMIGSYLGETASRLKRVFDYVRTIPCVLFFDEFDAIGKERGDIHETGEIKRVVTSLLMQIDELPSYAIVVAATNHPELLDRASWRRFQLRLQMPLPDEKTLAMFIGDRLGHLEGFDSEIESAVARALGNTSFADAEEFCLEVQRRSVLSLGSAELRAILSEQLALRPRSKSNNPKLQRTGSLNGGATASSPSKRSRSRPS